MLVEAAWSARNRPYLGRVLKQRSEDQPQKVLAYSFQTQLRLHTGFWCIAYRSTNNVAVVATMRNSRASYGAS